MLLFEAGDFGDIRFSVLEIRKIAVAYELDVIPDFLQVKGKEHVASLEIAQLQYEIYLGVNESQLLRRPLLRRGQREILTSLFLREAWPPIECLYLVAAKNDEALAQIVHRFPPCRETPKWRNNGAFRRTTPLFATVYEPYVYRLQARIH